MQLFKNDNFGGLQHYAVIKIHFSQLKITSYIQTKIRKIWFSDIFFDFFRIL